MSGPGRVWGKLTTRRLRNPKPQTLSTRYSTLRSTIPPYCIILYDTVPYHTVTILCCTFLYYTIPCRYYTTQRTQYPLIKEYALNHLWDYTEVLCTSISQGQQETRGSLAGARLISGSWGA